MKNKFLVITSRRSSRRFIPSIFATALTLVFSVETTNAASLSWDGSDTVTAGAQGGAGNWNVNSTANWWDGTADVVWPALGGTDDDAIFEGTAGTVTLTSAITANDLTFNTTGYILSGAQTLTLNGTTPTITVGTSITATIGNGTATVLAGSAGLTKAGAGTLILSGSLANTFTGKTSVTGGTLSIAADTALGAAPGAAVADQLTLNGGALRITAGAQTLNANRGITLGASGGTIDSSTIAGTAITTTVGGVITGTGPLTLRATGNMSANGGGDGGLGIRLNQATNTFIGDVTITAGLVNYANNLSFGDAANKIILNGGGLLDNNTNIALARDIEIQAGGGTFRIYGSVNVVWSGALTGSGTVNRTDGGTLTFSGDLSGFTGTYNNQGGNTTLTGTAASTIGGNWTISGGTLTVNSTANQTLGGTISSTGILSKTGSGTLTLTGNNSGIAGGVSANGGVLSVSNIADTGTTSQIGNWSTGANPYLAVANGGTFRYTGTAAATTGRNLWIDTGAGGTIDVSDAAGSLTFSGTGGNQTQRVTKAGLGSLTLDDVINGGSGAVTVSAGTLNLRGINTYTGTTVINGGTLSLTGATGAITSATATTIATGGSLKIDNSTASVADRFGLGAINLSGGTLDYFHNGAAATNYSETLGVVSVASGGTITTSQAAVGQTSTLTLGGLVGSPNFIGTGLGVDARNRILITGRANGATVGLYNTTGVAVYDTTLGVVEATLTDVPFVGTIADSASSNVRLTGGVSGDVLLAGTPTTVNSIFQNQTSATTIDNTAQILRLGAAGGILLPSGVASLTIGTAADSGTLTAGGAAATAGTLNLTNHDATAVLTVNSIIADNGAIVGVATSGQGKVVLAGTNTYTGSTALGAATTEFSGASQTLPGAISGTGTLLKTNASSTLTLTGPSTFTGATTLSEGIIAATVNTTQKALGTSAVEISNSATLQLNNTNTSATAVTLGNTFTGGGLLKLVFSAGTTATGTAMNNVTGFTGTIQLSNTGASGDKWALTSLGTINAALVIDSGSQLYSSGGTTTFSNGITVSGTGNNENRGAIRISGTVGGNVSLAGSTTIGTEGGTLTGNISSGAAGTQTLTFAGAGNGAGTFTGNIGGGTGTIAVTKSTPGLVTLSGNNSYSGGTTVTSGELRASLGTIAGAKSVFGSDLVTANNGTTLRFLAGSTANAMSHTNNIALNNAILISEDAVQTYSGTLTLTGTNSFQVPFGTKNAILSNSVSGPGIFNKSGAGTLVLSGDNSSFTSAISVAGPLALDYATNDNRKISSGVLTMSGGSIELAGGTFADGVTSTTLTASTANTINRSSGTATLDLGAITINTASSLNFGQSGIARTTNANNANGILGTWATIGGSQFAMNDGTGLIVAAASTDLTRLSSGPKEIADGATNHVRFIEGTGTAANFTLGSAITTINTLTQSSEGGTTAATVDLDLKTLALNTVTVGIGAGALTIGSALNNGTLKAAGTAIEFRDLAAAGITVNSIIADGTGATTLTKTDPGVLTLAGTNSYSGGTTVNAGTLTASLGTTAGVRFPFGSAAITANSGTTLRMFAGGTTNAMTFGNAFNLNAATLTSEDANQTYLGNIALTGANTVNVTYSDKSATFSGIVSGGGSLTKASPGVLTLSNANSYTGGTTISGGTIRTANTAALGAAGQALTLSGGTLQLSTDTALSSKNVTVSANSTITLDRATTGAGVSTSLGTLTFGSNLTLSVNKGANVASGVSTLNFTGFPALGAANTTTTFSVGQDVDLNISGSLTAVQAFARVTKTGAGTLILSGNNNWWDPAANTGLVTISAGTLDLRSQNSIGDGNAASVNRIDLSMAASSRLRLGTDTALANTANVTLTGSGATIVSDRNTAGAGITNQLNVLSIGAHTLNVTGGSNVTSGTTQVNFNSATLTGNATLNVVNPAAGSTNVLVSGVMSGAFGLTKSGSGTLTLQGANTYSTTTAVSGGTLNLSGAAGAIASSTGITLSTGGILTLANTSTANNGNRIAGTLAMNGGTLNFTNNAGAVNYSETTGNLSIGGGTNTIATGQAATSQTSTLAFGTLSRTAGTVNFTGTGLGVDARNRITFTGGVTSGQAIGTWATFNGTDFAAYDTTNGVVALTAYTDVTRLESGTKAIANTATNNVRIIEGTGISPASITLAAPTTTINTLNQSTFEGTSAATIDPGTTDTLAVNSILVSSGAGSLTIGTTAGDGTLKSAGTSLQVIENSSGGSTINSTIANGTAASTFTKSGTGLLTLTGTNTYTGATTIEGGILAVSVMANGSSNSGIGASAAAAGNLILNNGTLRYTGNTVSSNRGFTLTAATTGTVDVSTSAQTLTLSGGIAATTGNLVKSGAGILTLSAASAHSGTTAVTGSGKLTVSSTMLNASAFSAGTGSTLEFGATNIFVGGHGTALADTRVITVDGGTLLFNASADFRFGNVTLSNGATWTSNRVLTNYDALLANTASGAATVRVTGTGASMMNGSGGIHLQGVQNFEVADVTASTATDLTVSMILAAQGTIGGAAGGINKTGTGTMSLQGVNTYTGATNVVAGVLAIGTGGSTQTTSTITVASGATLRLDRGDTWGNHQATSSSPIVVNQGGTLASNGLFNTIVNPTLNGGTVTLNGGSNASYPALAIKGTLTVGGTAASTINVGTGTNNFINIGPSGTAGTLIVNVADATASTATDLTINSVLQNNWNAAGTVQVASVLQKTGLGTLNLAPAGGGNTFTGGLTVSNGLVLLTGTNLGNSVAGAGTLTIDTDATARAMSHNSLGQGTGTLSPLFVNGGTFEGAEYNHINTITMTGGSIAQRSGITVVDGLDMKVYSAVNPSITTNASATQANISLKISNSSAGPLTANVADGAAATDLSISAVIAGSQSVIKAGAGTLNLTGANTYAGGTTVNQGTLTVGTGGTLGATTGALAVGNNNTVAAGTATVLNLATAVDTTVGSLSGSIAIPTPASPANSATINVATGRTLTINQTVAGTFEGVIAGDGGVTLGASSTNTLTLTGNNTYTGATSVAAGTLALVGGSQASPITVSSGASLSFTIGSPTTSTSSFNLTSGTIKISGTPTLPSYTLITTSTGISGTPALDTPIAGYSLVKSGNTLKLETPYGTWLNSTFANALTQTGLEDDPDGDGIKNLLEFAFGTDPTVNSTASVSFSPSVVPGQPILEEDAGVWYAVFARRTDYVAAGLTYTVEFSSALSSWEATATAPTFLATDGTIDVVRVPFLNFVDISGPNGPQKPTFFRVKVSE